MRLLLRRLGRAVRVPPDELLTPAVKTGPSRRSARPCLPERCWIDRKAAASAYPALAQADTHEPEARCAIAFSPRRETRVRAPNHLSFLCVLTASLGGEPWLALAERHVLEPEVSVRRPGDGVGREVALDRAVGESVVQ